jgi:hypothetical protein
MPLRPSLILASWSVVTKLFLVISETHWGRQQIIDHADIKMCETIIILVTLNAC